MASKVDAKIELIRVELTRKIEDARRNNRELSTDSGREHGRGFVSGLEEALRVVSDVDRRVR